MGRFSLDYYPKVKKEKEKKETSNTWQWFFPLFYESKLKLIELISKIAFIFRPDFIL